MRRFQLKYRAIAILWGLLAVTGAAQTGGPREGFVQVPGGRVWYRIVGAGPKTPLLMVHGGPGMGSCYLSDLADRLAKDRPVILYDQLESGRSDHPWDRSLWTLDRFVDELAVVRKELKLDRVHLFGHSWGAAVVAEYLLRDRPSGIESVTFAGPLLSTPQWVADTKVLIAELPQSVQRTLAKHERDGTVASREYSQAAAVYYNRYVLRRPLPPMTGCPFNQAIYEHMWGPTEFSPTGTLKNFDRTNRISELKMPVLFLVGRFDEARVATMTSFQRKIPGSRIEVIQNAGHMAMTDAPEPYARALRLFLK